MIKRAYFHPLSHLPGNKLLSSTYFFLGIAGLSGRSHYFLPLGHKYYGKIFRFSPDIVSIADKDMIKEVRKYCYMWASPLCDVKVGVCSIY